MNLKNNIEKQSFVSVVPKLDFDKGRDHSHVTRKDWGPAHEKCNKIFNQKQSNFIPKEFHEFINYNCHLFFNKLADKRKNEVKLHTFPKSNEISISVTCGCSRFFDSCDS